MDDERLLADIAESRVTPERERPRFPGASA